MKRFPSRHILLSLCLTFLLIMILLACWQQFQPSSKNGGISFPDVEAIRAENEEAFLPETIPEYSGNPYIPVNENEPFFDRTTVSDLPFETYAELDEFGRCGVAYACLSFDTMPTEKRQSIGTVKPSGWKTVRYDSINGGYLYNRCHLIAYQLAGENANEKNLITGTRYLNTEGMLPFENMVSDYIKETGGHVLYRVTPVFDGDNLVASGVLMEGLSVEDDGDSICYCVYCYNVQPGIRIDYRNGDSWEESSEEHSSEQQESQEAQPEQGTYVLNIGTRKFHRPSCGSTDSIFPSNREEYTGDRQTLIDCGYAPCGSCKP